MKTKKHPKANLENYSKIFTQLGLVLALSVIHILINQKTFDKDIAILNDSGITIDDFSEENIEYKIEKKVAPIKKVKISNEIIKVEDDVDTPDIFIEPTDPDTPVDVSDIVDIDEPEDIKIEDDYNILSVEVVPSYPGCKGDNEELKECLSKKVSKFIQKKFNADLANQLGLQPGIQRIFTVFKIDKKGDIVDVKIRAPHKSLEKEAFRVIHLLPKMKPGLQGGSPVNVKYSMPITFKVE